VLLRRGNAPGKGKPGAFCSQFSYTGSAKYSPMPRKQPELNLCCISCNKREWDVDKKNVNATSNGSQIRPIKRKIEFDVSNSILYS